MIKAETTTLPYCCGIIEIGAFGSNDSWLSEPLNQILETSSWSGLMVSVFIDNKVCKKAYKLITKHCQILYQSPVVFNISSGNDLFLLVYKAK